MVRVGIVGASGYSGAELMRILSVRKDVALVAVTANTSAGQRVDALYPALAGSVDLEFRAYDPAAFPDVDVAFVALPSGQGMGVVPDLLERAGKVIDLGGDFRLKDPALYEQFYRHTHTAPSLLPRAVYGLPEMNGPALRTASLVANPGCYPTSAILGLLPALKAGIVKPEGIVVNSVSGISGAGRSASVEMSFSELNENVRAYKIGAHQHVPEIESALRDGAGTPVTVSFVPHLVPITRGIHTTISAAWTSPVTADELRELYASAYAGAPFVRVTGSYPQIQSVVRTNYCDVHPTVDRRAGRVVILSVIDNLVKGAAGQAVQNMNLMCGFPEETGLR
jgi:N-acetyl-gamma-glutamyl-phosphate reductase